MKGKDTHFPTKKTLLDHPVDPKVSIYAPLLTGSSLHGAEGISSGCDLQATESTLGWVTKKRELNKCLKRTRMCGKKDMERRWEQRNVTRTWTKPVLSSKWMVPKLTVRCLWLLASYILGRYGDTWLAGVTHPKICQDSGERSDPLLRESPLSFPFFAISVEYRIQDSGLRWRVDRREKALKVALFPRTLGLDYELGLKKYFTFSLPQSPKHKMLQEQVSVWRNEKRVFSHNHMETNDIASKENHSPHGNHLSLLIL